jgi:transcriptional regulator with XRE-family HTH domain
MGSRWWKPGEIEALKRLWPDGSRQELDEALPNRKQHMRAMMAVRLGLKRKRHHRRVHLLFGKLREIREQKKIKRETVARRAGFGLNTLCDWETGKHMPGCLGLFSWIEALGLELKIEQRRTENDKRLHMNRAALIDRIEELEELLGVFIRVPDAIGLTQHERMVLGMIVKRKGVVSREAIFIGVYGARPEIDQPDMKIVDVVLCKIRKGLEPYGIKIETAWGIGYYMTEEMRAKTERLLAESSMQKAA